MLIAVAGGTGFIGAATARALAADGPTLRCLSRDPERARARLGGLYAEYVRADTTDLSMLEPALRGADVLISAVQFPNFPVENPRQGWTFDKVDRQGSVHLALAAQAAGVGRYVYLSGAGASATSRWSWFRAKAGAEAAILAGGIPYTIFRPSWVYGPGDHSLNRFVAFARRLPFVPMIGSGNSQVWPLFIDDLTGLIRRSLSAPEAANRVFEIGGPDRLSMNQIVDSMLGVLGSRKRRLHAPVAVVKLAAWLLQYLPGRPLTPDAVDFILTAGGDVDSAPALAVLGGRLTPLREGLGTYLGPAARRRAASAH